MLLEDRFKFLLEVKEVLDKHKVEFWVDFGTLLGFYRQGDFLETDPDIDLGVKREQLNKVIEAAKELSEKFKIITRVEQGKYSYLAGFKICKDDTWIDIAFYFQYENKRIWTISQWKKVLVFPEYFFDKLVNIDINGTLFKIPCRTEELMVLKYGKDWRRPFKAGEEYDLHALPNVESNEKYLDILQ